MSIAERIIKQRGYWLLIIAVWSAIVGGSMFWNISSIEVHQKMMATERGRIIFDMVQLTRRWNASHGGVYVPITKKTQPNPFLETPVRDVNTTEGLRLTMINPAFMTRQMSEMIEKAGVTFHLTSLKPIRPGNRADAWEKHALQEFEEGLAEKTDLISGAGNTVFRYMAPLRVKAPCLICHAKQGYMIGEIRGGLSVDIDADGIIQSTSHQQRFVVTIHSIAWLLVSLLLFGFLRSSHRQMMVMEGAQSVQRRVIDEQSEALSEADEKIRDLITRDSTTGLYEVRHFHTLAASAWRDGLKSKKPLSMILLNVDSFSSYNENYGALEGDICLKQIAKVIAAQTTPSGTIAARYGGASFIILLRNVSRAEAHDITGRIQGGVLALKIPHETSKVAKVVTITGTVTTVTPSADKRVSLVIKDFMQCFRNRRRMGSGNHIYDCST